MAPIIRHHHERIDGQGYPDRLSGDQIPLGSRIIAVTETYDSLTSLTTYCHAVDKKTAVGELKRVSEKIARNKDCKHLYQHIKIENYE